MSSFSCRILFGESHTSEIEKRDRERDRKKEKGTCTRAKKEGWGTGTGKEDFGLGQINRTEQEDREQGQENRIGVWARKRDKR